MRTQIYLTGTPDDDKQFFIYAKDKRDAQRQWFKATGEKLAACAFVDIPKKKDMPIYSFDTLPKFDIDKGRYIKY